MTYPKDSTILENMLLFFLNELKFIFSSILNMIISFLTQTFDTVISFISGRSITEYLLFVSVLIICFLIKLIFEMYDIIKDLYEENDRLNDFKNICLEIVKKLESKWRINPSKYRTFDLQEILDYWMEIHNAANILRRREEEAERKKQKK